MNFDDEESDWLYQTGECTHVPLVLVPRVLKALDALNLATSLESFSRLVTSPLVQVGPCRYRLTISEAWGVYFTWTDGRASRVSVKEGRTSELREQGLAATSFAPHGAT